MGNALRGGTANPAVLVAGMHAPPDVETTVDGLPALRQQQAAAGASHPPRSVGGTHKHADPRKHALAPTRAHLVPPTLTHAMLPRWGHTHVTALCVLLQTNFMLLRFAPHAHLVLPCYWLQTLTTHAHVPTPRAGSTHTRTSNCAA